MHALSPRARSTLIAKTVGSGARPRSPRLEVLAPLLAADQAASEQLAARPAAAAIFTGMAELEALAPLLAEPARESPGVDL